MSYPTFISCLTCDNKDIFTITNAGKKFIITCNNCGKEVRQLPAWRFRPDEERKLKYVALTFGKYKDTIIYSMVKSDEIQYLRWLVYKSGYKLKGNVRWAIHEHLKNFKSLEESGQLFPDILMGDRKVIDKPLEAFKKNFDENSLPI